MLYSVNQDDGTIDAIKYSYDGGNYLSGYTENKLIGCENGGIVKGFFSVNVDVSFGAEKSYKLWIVPERVDRDGWYYGNGDFSVTMKYSSGKGKLFSKLVVNNESDSDMTVNSLSVSIPSNNNYCPYYFNQKYLFESKTLEHYYISGENSYVRFERINGNAPMLYMLPINKNRFEYVCHLEETMPVVKSGMPNQSYYGTMRLFYIADGYLKENNYEQIFCDEKAADNVVCPNCSMTFETEIGFADGKADFYKYFVEKGNMFFKAHPSFCCSKNQNLTITVDSLAEVKLLSDVPCVRNGRNFTFRFDESGEKKLYFTDGSKTAFVNVFICEDAMESLEKRCRFIIDNQVYNNPGSVLDGAILPYYEKDVYGYKAGIFAAEGSLWGTGSYEGGICEACFMAQKNLVKYDRDEVEFLEDYTNRYVLNYLQNPETYDVCWFKKDFYPYRSYNYIHLANFYLCMHKIAEYYGGTVNNSQYYLELTYRTLMRMFEISRAMDIVVGNMGESVLYETLNAMASFDQKYPGRDFNLKYMELKRKINLLVSEIFSDIPYASECAYDNTGFDAIAYIADKTDKQDIIDDIEKIILANKGDSPIWWWNGSECRWWDGEQDSGEICHHYPAPYNSRALLNLMSKGRIKTTEESLSVAYSGLFGAIAKIRRDGFASMCYVWEQESKNYGFHYFTGDSGLSDFAFLKGIRAFVTDEKCYLCDRTGDNRFVMSEKCIQQLTVNVKGSVDSVDIESGAIIGFCYDDG
ncbi:MAG: DUF5695 domain-containing protein, partial [Christensenellales bacterium]